MFQNSDRARLLSVIWLSVKTYALSLLALVAAIGLLVLLVQQWEFQAYGGQQKWHSRELKRHLRALFTSC